MNKIDARKNILQQKRMEIQYFIEDKKQQNDLKHYHFMSANILHLLPEIPIEEHPLIYEKILTYKFLNSVSDFFQTFDLTNFFKNFDYDQIRENLPAIFVSYHIGAYRSAIIFLVKYGIDVALIMDPVSYQFDERRNEMINQFEMAKKLFKSSSNLVIYPADKADLTFQLMGEMKKNYSVLAYIDSNSGFNGALNQKNSLTVNFFNQEIKVRQGLAMLSYVVRRPIIAMLSNYDENYEPNWNIYSPIQPSGFRTVHAYCDFAMQQLYTNLENVLRDNYNQWEGWHSIHKFLILKEDSEQSFALPSNQGINSFCLDEHAGFFTFSDSHYVINKRNYKLNQITPDLLKALIHNRVFNTSVLEPNVLFQLNKLGIIKEHVEIAL